MTNATYRGVSYDTDVKKERFIKNWLPMIREQIEKEARLHEAQIIMAKK